MYATILNATYLFSSAFSQYGTLQHVFMCNIVWETVRKKFIGLNGYQRLLCTTR
jgi:hypothetical protein